jgi:hypothetical protein
VTAPAITVATPADRPRIVDSLVAAFTFWYLGVLGTHPDQADGEGHGG